MQRRNSAHCFVLPALVPEETLCMRELPCNQHGRCCPQRRLAWLPTEVAAGTAPPTFRGYSKSSLEAKLRRKCHSKGRNVIRLQATLQEVFFIFAALWLLMISASPALAADAFPGAEGFGAKSVGGRGGRVIEVSNLNDSGPGSLRAAVEASGPRIIVFRTGGTITLNSPLMITNAYITVAGQTAPGGGICLRNAPTNGKTCIFIATHDVVVRHLRVRPGRANAGIKVDSHQAMQIGKEDYETYNVILDHCSFTWGIDGDLQTGSQAHDITIQWCLISEGLNNAGHSKGAHSRALNFYVGSARSNRAENGRVTVSHNLLSHVQYRVPQIATEHGLIEVINNLVYHTTQIGMNVNAHAHKVAGDSKTRFVKNYLLRTSSKRNDVAIASQALPSVLVYTHGNIGPSRPNDTLADNLTVEASMRSHWTGDPLCTSSSGTFPYPAIRVTEDASAQVTLERISETGIFAGVKNVGAILPQRDAVDTRILQQLKNYIANPSDPNTVPVSDGSCGGLLDDPDQVGGYPTLSAGTPPLDSDHDGMPDAWETSHGLNPKVDDSALDRDADGYTNIEEYINSLTAPGPKPPTRLERLAPLHH